MYLGLTGELLKICQKLGGNRGESWRLSGKSWSFLTEPGLSELVSKAQCQARKAQKGKKEQQQQKGYYDLVWCLEAVFCVRKKDNYTHTNISVVHSHFGLLDFHWGGGFQWLFWTSAHLDSDSGEIISF